MDVSSLLTVAQAVLQLLDSPIMREIKYIWNFKSQLAKMKDTMTTIKAVLLDAEEQERQQVQHSNVDCDWLEKLRLAVYQADDLFDKIVTISHQEKLTMEGKVNKMVLNFVFRPALAFSMSAEIKKIRGGLDNIAKDRRDFGSTSLKHHVSGRKGSVRRRVDTHSFVRDKDVIGRDHDKDVVVDMLLNSEVKEDVSFVSIIGIGGLGKTTLAQLVYNDEKIKKEFALKLWVCVSEEFDVKAILTKLLGSLPQEKHEGCNMEKLQSEFREKIDGKKYLLVLDDVWNEDRQGWLELENLLLGGGRGSRVIVTTRSRKVGRIIGKDRAYELKGLSEDDSWRLFERMAFEGEDEVDVDLFEIGKAIVRKCANVPLAIKTVGSLLYGEGETTWRTFKNIDLASIEQNENGIIPILKLSYYHLAAHLKSCLNYCVLFPKDYEIEKEVLISLWTAQGYLLPLDGQTVEDVGEDYFTTLLQRCFLESMKRDDYGGIETCKIHDLMHDVVQEVAGAEFLVAKSLTSQFSEHIHHISVEGSNVSIASCLARMKSVRTFLHFQHGQIAKKLGDKLIQKGKCLRVLDLHRSWIRSLPSTIDRLLHLRYLDLSYNAELEVLPASVTKLYNLKVLNLSNCHGLIELPKRLRKLSNLRHLDTSHCHRLTHMPPRMKCLTSLQRLTMFVVGGSSHGHGLKHVGQLEDLRALTELKGDLTIRVREGFTVNKGVTRAGVAGYLMSNICLRDLCIEWGTDVSGQTEDEEALLEGIEPHPNLRSFELKKYHGARFPSWVSLKKMAPSHAKIVKISFKDCTNLQYLPSFSHLHHLKTLELYNLKSLEYIDNNDTSFTSASARSGCSFFPSLEVLRIDNLPKLKGWSKCVSLPETMQPSFQGSGQPLSLPTLSRLTELVIWDCPHLSFIPVCPNVEKLFMRRFKDSLLDIVTMKNANVDPPSLESLLSSLSPTQGVQVSNLEINNVGYVLRSLPLAFDENHCSWLKIKDFNLETLSTFKEAFQKHEVCSQVRSLEISNCRELRTFSGGGLEHFTALERLRLEHLPVINLSSVEENQQGNGLPWKPLQSLRTLALDSLPMLVELPHGMQYLNTLQSIRISHCANLSALPEWVGSLKSLEYLHLDHCQGLKSLPESMRHLTCLRRLEIWQCSPDLTDRCRQPTGEDWPKIRHIPLFSIHTY